MGQGSSNQDTDTTVRKPPSSAMLPRRKINELNTMYNQEQVLLKPMRNSVSVTPKSKQSESNDINRQRFLAKMGFVQNPESPAAHIKKVDEPVKDDMFSLLVSNEIVTTRASTRVNELEISQKIIRSNQVRASLAYKLPNDQIDEVGEENNFDLPPEVKQTLSMTRGFTQPPKTFSEMTALPDQSRQSVRLQVIEFQPVQLLQDEPIDLSQSYKATELVMPFFVPLNVMQEEAEKEDYDNYCSTRTESRCAIFIDKEPRLVARTANQIRIRYLQKLTYAGVWLPPTKQSKSHQTLFILDWDDTIFPTQFLKEKGGPGLEQNMWGIAEKVTQKYKHYLARWQKSVLEILAKMMKMGRILIITNAQENWVEAIAEIMMPRVELFIRQYVPVISAAQFYEKQFPYQADQWKLRTFMDLWEMEDVIDPAPECLLNLVVVGDQDFEMNAGKNFNEKMKHGKTCILKLVKLQHEPSPCQFEKQLHIMNQKIESIACSFKPMNQVIQTPKNTWKIE